jgi:MarR family transcriptional regulator, organic hydroperoxide resistance regulator
MNETIADEVYDYLERIGNLIRMDARRVEPVRGLQPVQLEALHYLASCNRYSNTPIAVADYLGLTKGTVSQTLSVLEANGLIEKMPDLHDRRVVRLSLTQAGADLIREAIPPRVLKGGVARLPENSRESLVAVLRLTLQAMQQANHLKSFGVCKTCRHHRVEENGGRWCGLTREALYPTDAEQICREHEAPEPLAGAA